MNTPDFVPEYTPAELLEMKKAEYDARIDDLRGYRGLLAWYDPARDMMDKQIDELLAQKDNLTAPTLNYAAEEAADALESDLGRHVVISGGECLELGG